MYIYATKLIKLHQLTFDVGLNAIPPNNKEYSLKTLTKYEHNCKIRISNFSNFDYFF